MEQQILREIQWTEYGQTVLHPLSLVLLLAMAAVLLQSRKTYFVIPFLVVAALLTHMQRLVIGSFDFSMLRLLMIAAVARALIRNDTNGIEWNRMDSRFIAYVVVASVTYVMLWRNASAVVNRLGFAFEALLAFYLIRMYVRSETQITVLIRGLALIFSAVAFFMIVEQTTRYNFFSIFGGVSPITALRQERLRAQGAFSHPIMAGTFGATFAPLFWALKSRGKGRDTFYAMIGAFGALVIVWASSSSGPVLSLLASIFAISMWRFRQHTRVVRRGVVLMLVGLHMVMEAPVWHLISRVDIVGGSTGWHRYALIDNAIRRVPEWAAVGVRTTGHWGWGLNDVTNQFIAQAVNGGLLTLLAFILVVSAGFRSVGTAVRQSAGDEALQKMHWAWGSVLFSHCVSFFGVTYFGQMTYFWYLTLAVIACLPSVTKVQETRATVRLGLDPGKSSVGTA